MGHVLKAVTLSAMEREDQSLCFVMGGPLVRAPRKAALAVAPPYADLSDTGGSGWHLRVGNEHVREVGQNEKLGFVSTSPDRSDVIYVFGVRDAGTVVAVDWLKKVLGKCSSNRFAEAAEFPWMVVDAELVTHTPTPWAKSQRTDAAGLRRLSRRGATVRPSQDER